MKKTAQTLLTAAMFVSALGGSAAGKDSMKCNASGNTAAAATTTTTGLEAFMTTGPVLYGPPWVFGTTTTETVTEPTTEQTTNPGTEPVTELTDIESTTFMTMTTPEILYGPPHVFMDMNRDFSLDARDLTLMKRKALGQLTDGSYIGDVDHSGTVDRHDVDLLLHEGLGVPYKPVVTTAPVEPGTTTRTTVTQLTEQTTLPPTTPTTPQVVYTTKRTEEHITTGTTVHAGTYPNTSATTLQTAETLQRTTETAVMPLYGPPPAFDK
ncbi:MAG: hypothetical protein K5705_04190 [Oscillospiraceae bacterium]|nr:hypothetical protein [Oscillospiraceae bacterium]